MFVTFSRFFFFTAFVLCSLFAISVRGQEESETVPNPVVATSDSGAYHAVNQLPEYIRRSAPFAREFYEFALHAGNSGTVDNDAYLRTFAEAQQDMLRANESTKLGKNSTQATEGTWSNIGLTGGDTIPSAGINTVIVFDPQHANIMYAGGSGGVWKSYDTGATWTNLTDNILPNLAVASIGVDPVNSNIVYVGTGYCYNSIPSYGGSGLYKSTDGGATFALLTALTGTQFIKVVVDPAKDNIVLAAGWDQGAVYRSTDFGTTWKSVLANGTPWDIIATPGNAGFFYTITSGGVYKSTNDGSTWTKVTSSANFFTSSIGRAALASPTKAPNKIIALVTDASTNGLDSLYESTDAGVTWKSDPTILPGLFVIPGSTIFHPQGWYDLYLAVSPNSITDDTIYAGGVLAFKKSGGNWVTYSDYGHSGGGGGYPHVDHHSFAVNPLNSNIVYDGDDGGLWVNYASGSNDVSSGGGWKLHSFGMTTNRFNHLGLDKNNIKVTWAGAQDQGLWKITQGVAPVQQNDFGDALSAVVSSSNSNHVYGEGPDAEILQATNASAQNWASTADSALGLTDAVGWDNPFKMSPVLRSGTGGNTIPAANILYVGRQHVWQTTNSGTSWTKFSPSFGAVAGGLSYCTAIGLPNWNANMIYIAGGGSSFELSTNFGVSWVARTNPGYVTSINTSQKDPKFVVVSLASNNKKVEMSEDSGHTWTDVSGTSGAQIPGADANSSCNVMGLAIDSASPLTTWYAATDFGVYETSDAGQHWVFMGPGLVPCRDIQIATNMVTMRVATYGRGVWEVQLPIDFNDVESTTLTASKSAAGTELSWSVEGEPSGATFYVERSVSGDAFARIGSVAGVGASTGTEPYSFTDAATEPGTYLYRIHEMDANGAEHFSNQVELHYGTNGLYLYQPYPNPLILGNVANTVTLNFELPARDNVQIRLYDIKGALVRTLLNKSLDGGPQSAIWDARDESGTLVQPGAYFYAIQSASSGIMSGKIMVVRE